MAFNLSVKIYKITQTFPKDELYGLTSQIRRCAISIPSNIAEGRGRNSDKDFSRFLHMAISSLNELDCQILIAKELNYIKVKSLFNEDIDHLRRMIFGFIKILHK